MSDKTKAKGDAFAGSDASGVKVTQVFADLKETLSDTDPEQLSKNPETDTAIDTLTMTNPVAKEDSPEVYHDNICDPADIKILPSDDPMHKVAQTDAQETPVERDDRFARLKGTDALRKKEEDDNASGLSENFILEGHSYL
ncbi:MAG: hypothetical protein JWO03_3366 [Bacteroidetes bacterium]|nr:hypothetical protein [Bacteroidota bacterium]